MPTEYLLTFRILFTTLLILIAWVLFKMIRERKHNIISNEVKYSKRRLLR